MKQYIFTFVFGASALMAGCSGQGTTVGGSIASGGAQKTLWVEQVLPAGPRFVDSVRTDRDGVFRVSLNQKSSQKSTGAGDNTAPEFYNLRIPGGGIVPLLVARGEQVTLSIADSTAGSYTVSGSEGSAQVQEVNGLLGMHSRQLDSLEQLFEAAQSQRREEQIAGQYAELQTARKQAVIAFLMRNAGSMATVVPLYQPLRSGEFVLGEPEDVFYYRSVADTLSARYPDAPYTRALLTDVTRMENLVGSTEFIRSNLDNEVSFPDLNLRDVLGNPHRLSELKGKVILLSFTSSDFAEFKMQNRELVDTYNAYKDRGFEVYQVFLDLNKAQWINSIAEQRLPWITVCDFRGAASPAVTLYGVRTVPTNFLIDRTGTIVKRGLLLSEIESSIRTLL